MMDVVIDVSIRFGSVAMIVIVIGYPIVPFIARSLSTLRDAFFLQILQVCFKGSHCPLAALHPISATNLAKYESDQVCISVP